MACFLVDGSTWKTTLDALDDAKCREIRRRMVENGAKVLIKEMQQTIENRHHVISGSMRNDVAAGEIKEDLDGTSISVWPQGYDSRGVRHEMKAKYIINGRRNAFSGRKTA